MRALTVQQPWAWAVVHAGKLTENRSVPWAYRGELAIHAGTRWSDRGGEDPRVTAAAWEAGGDFRPTAQLHGPDFLLPGPERPVGCIIGLSDMVDAHPSRPAVAPRPNWVPRCSSPPAAPRAVRTPCGTPEQTSTGPWMTPTTAPRGATRREPPGAH